MCLVSGVRCQKLWQVVNDHVIHATLHRAKQVVVKVWNVDCLMNDQVECPPRSRVIISNHATHSGIGLCAEGLIIAHHVHRSLIVQND